MRRLPILVGIAALSWLVALASPSSGQGITLAPGAFSLSDPNGRMFAAKSFAALQPSLIGGQTGTYNLGGELSSNADFRKGETDSHFLPVARAAGWRGRL